MDLEELKKFCCTEHVACPSLGLPFSSGEFTYACDHRTIVRIPRLADVPENPKAPVADKIWESVPLGVMKPLVIDETRVIDDEACRLCDGGGKVYPQKTCEKCDGEGECAECGETCRKCSGTGKMKIGLEKTDLCPLCAGTGYSRRTLKWGNSNFNVAFLRRIQTLPNCSLLESGDGEGKPHQFIFDGGDGLVIGMKSNEQS